ncbi:hypothetical protein V6N13_047470 [Hibiscus sabdariffa]
MRLRRRFVYCLANSICRHCKNTPLSLHLLFSAQPHRKRFVMVDLSSFEFCRSEILNNEDWLWMVEEQC